MPKNMRTLLTFLILAVVAKADTFTRTYNITNDTLVPVTVQVIRVGLPDDTEYLEDTVTIAVGKTFSKAYTLELTESFGETLKMNYLGGSGTLVGNSYISDTGEEEYTLFTTFLPGTDTISFNLTTYITVFGRAPTPDDKKSLWLLDDTTLTADLYREGVDKIVAAVGISGESSTGGTGGGPNAEYVATRQKAYLQNPSGAGTTESELNTFIGEAAEQGETAKNAVEDAINEATENHTLTSTRFDTTNSGDSDFSITYEAMGRTFTLNFDPATNEKLSNFILWVKGFIAWALLILFEWFLWSEFQKYYFNLMGTAPAKGNPVVGGTGAQVTSLLVATLITAVLATIPVLFWAAADSGMTWASGIATTNPIDDATGVLAKGVYLAQYCFPLGTCLAATTTAFFIRKFGLLMVVGTHTVTRFFIA